MPTLPRNATLAEVIRLINGGLGLGTPARPDAKNLDCDPTVSITFTALQTDTNATHNLGRIPAGYIVIGATTPGMVYDGSGALSEGVPASWTSSQITLRVRGPGWDETAALGTYRLLVFLFLLACNSMGVLA